MARLPKVGDVILIGEFPTGKVVGHYLHEDPNEGPMVRFYGCAAEWTLREGIARCEPLFPPVYVGINPPVRTGRWKVIGALPVDNFKFPQFLATNGYAGRPGDWWLYDGRKDRVIGPDVPKHLQDLEVMGVWPADLLEERIRTGVNPFSYEARRKW